MIIVTLKLAFADCATDYDIKDCLEDIQSTIECCDEAPQCIFADWWPGNAYAFHDYPRYAPKVWPEGQDKTLCPHGAGWHDCLCCRY